MENNGITVGHLLQLQTDINKTIRDSEQRIGDRIDRLATQQAVANGRVGKLEGAVARLRKDSQTGSLFGSLTAAQKAKLAGFGLVIAGAVAEGVHRLIPALIGLLSAAAAK